MTEIKVGKFIVYESAFRDRFMVRKVVGETAHYWEVINPRLSTYFGDVPPRRVKKSGIGPVGVFDDIHAANHAATGINEMLAKLKVDLDSIRKRLLDELSSAMKGEQNDAV